MSLDVLFINPSDQRAVYQDLSEELTALEPPVWCRLLASYVRGKGYSADICDMQIDPLTPFIDANKYRLFVVVVHGNQPSASTQTMPAAIVLCKFLKSNFPDTPLLVVGGHPAALPEKTLREIGADAVCTGEGPATIIQLLHLLDDQPIKWKWLLKDVDGLCYWDHDEAVRSNTAANIADLSGEIPGGCWDLLPMDKYRSHNWHALTNSGIRKPYASIYTSFGCPFSCLRGDTLINTIYGEIPIKELAETRISVPVYTYKPETGEVFITDAFNINKTGVKKRLVRVHFDDGSHIDCTPDHRFLQFKWGNGKSKSKQWECEARNLIQGAHVRAIRIEWGFYGRAYITWGRRKRQLRSRLVMEYLLDRKLTSKEHVHHRDHDKSNDHPSNLEYYSSAADHFVQHPEIAERMRVNNPTKNGMSTEWIEKLGAVNRGKKRSFSARLKYRESKLGEKNPNFKHGRTVNRSSRLGEINHVVLFIEDLIEKEDVYCMEVPETGWFFANNVLVHNCSFCMIQTPFREGDALKFHGAANSYRLWKPKAVIDELTLLQDTYGVRNVKIADEMFVLNRDHVDAICGGIIDRGLDLNAWAYARVDTVKRGPLSKMKKAGINWLALGIESASEHVRDGVEKADYGRKEILETCRIIREEGINVIANFIFGLPDDTRATMEETLDLAQEIMPEWVNMYSAQAYPGSKLYQQALKEGWPLPETWLGYSMHSYETQPLPTKTLSAAEVLEFSDNAFRIYFMNKNYLAMIQRKFGDTAVEQIKAMTAKRLLRRLLDEKEFRCA